MKIISGKLYMATGRAAIKHKAVSIVGLVGVIVALAAARTASAADTYSCQTLDVPGKTGTTLWRLNNAGQVAAGTDQGGFIYQSATGVWTPLPAPLSTTGIPAVDVGPEDINDNGVIVGAAGVTTSEGFLLPSLTGAYQFVPPPDGAVNSEFRAIGDNGLVTAIAYDAAEDSVAGFLYNPTAKSILGYAPGYKPLNPVLSDGSTSLVTILGSVNADGWFVGSGASDTHAAEGLLYIPTIPVPYLLKIPNISTRFRSINDLDPNSAANCTSANCRRIVGWGYNQTSGAPVGFYVDFDPVKGFQPPQIVDCGSAIPAGIQGLYFQGINNKNLITGLYTDAAGNDHGVIAYPNVEFPTTDANGAYTFHFTVSQSAVVYIDPAIASGYEYAIKPGDPAFQSVTLPIGIGSNNTYTVIVNGYAFSLPAGKKLDFSESGFPNGVTAFTVIGIDPGAQLSLTNTHAFVTGVSFVAAGLFEGTMTPLTTSTQAAHGGVSSCADLDAIRAAFGKKAGEAGFNSLADTNFDGVINVSDLIFAAHLIPSGTVCH